MLFVLHLGVGVWESSFKPLPEGLSVAGAPHRMDAAQVDFLFDVTYQQDGRRVMQQTIYDHTLKLIHGAEDVVLVDLFLFNNHLGQETTPYRPLSAEVVAALVERKRARPGIAIVVITDPVNEAYGSAELPLFAELRAAGIPVVSTNLARLRDSNPLYSAFWRTGVQWFGTSPGGMFPHPFNAHADSVGLRSWLALLNFKANHRKLIIADAAGADGAREMVAMVMSANPHDGSSAHSYVALQVRGGGLWSDLWQSEAAVLRISAPEINPAQLLPAYATQATEAATPSDAGSVVSVQLLTEGKIRRGVLAVIDGTVGGDTIDVAMFYLSERKIITALVDAAARGATIRLLLDPNRDAFGYEKSGIPNRPVATELVARGSGRIAVRWYDTHGEQFHTKLVFVRKQSGESVLITGSANLMRRNLGDFNLETDVAVAGRPEAPVFRNVAGYFERLWTNEDHAFTVSFEDYADHSGMRRWQYRLQERTGLGTF